MRVVKGVNRLRLEDIGKRVLVVDFGDLGVVFGLFFMIECKVIVSLIYSK